MNQSLMHFGIMHARGVHNINYIDYVHQDTINKSVRILSSGSFQTKYANYNFDRTTIEIILGKFLYDGKF